MNDFSMLCRLFGNLFYREPQSEILQPIWVWLEQGNLQKHWELSIDDQAQRAFKELEKKHDIVVLQQEYQQLLNSVSTRLEDYAISLEGFNAFCDKNKVPPVDSMEKEQHVARLLLIASWIEDQALPTELQEHFFHAYVLPVMAKFLGKIEAHTQTGVYRSLAQLCRDALAAMADQLEEDLEQENMTIA